MPIRNLSRIFDPKQVVVIGGSRKAGSLGRTVLANLADAKFPDRFTQ
jgi:acyl-CoA synthetase (NDP forming)